MILNYSSAEAYRDIAEVPRNVAEKIIGERGKKA